MSDERLNLAFVADNDTNTLLITRSNDGGGTWIRGAAPHESSKGAPAAAALGGGVSWLGFVANNDTNTLLACCTDDGGITWENNMIV